MTIRRDALAWLAAAAVLAAPQAAWAWKPNTHIYLADPTALDDGRGVRGEGAG